MESEELVLQIAAAVQPLQSSHGLFQMVLAGNESKTPLGTGFRGHFVRIVSTQPTPALLPALGQQCSGFSQDVVFSDLFYPRTGYGPAPMADLLGSEGRRPVLMFSNYKPQGGFDEYFAAPNRPRSCFEPLVSSLGHLGLEEVSRNHRAAETLLQQVGATFQLYGGDTDSDERILPFDPLPRLITAGDWAWLEAGLIQRLQAIDLFLDDIYGDQRIINDGVIPREYVETSQGWRPAMVGITPPLGRWCHVAGLGLIRDLFATKQAPGKCWKTICAVPLA